MAKLELNVEGMECTGCENRLKKALGDLNEVKEVKASHEDGKVIVILKHDLTSELKNMIIKTIENLDYKVLD